MIESGLCNLIESMQQDLGLSTVKLIEDPMREGLNRNDLNYGYVRIIDYELAKQFTYQSYQEGCGDYYVNIPCVAILDLRCKDKKVAHEKLVKWIAAHPDTVLRASGYNSEQIMIHEIGSSKDFEADGYLIAVWFDYLFRLSNCGTKHTNDYCLL